MKQYNFYWKLNVSLVDAGEKNYSLIMLSLFNNFYYRCNNNDNNDNNHNHNHNKHQHDINNIHDM